MNSHCVGSAEDLDGDFTDIINEPVSKPKKLKSEKSKKQSGQAKTTESKKGSFRALAWDTVHEASAVFSTYYQKATTKLTELEVEKQLNIPGTRLDHLVFLLCSHETKRTGFSLNLHLFLWVTGFLQIILMLWQKTRAFRRNLGCSSFAAAQSVLMSLSSMCTLPITAHALTTHVYRSMQKDAPGAKVEGSVAMLFSRHMKIDEQAKFLSKAPCSIAVGTPGRILQLAEAGHLQWDELELVMIDMWRDKKDLTVLMYPQLLGDVMKFIGKFLAKRLESGKTKISLAD